MAPEDTEGRPAVLDTDNLEKPGVPEDFTDSQVPYYPELAELVGDDNQQYDIGEDQVPPANP
jgi:hypothetical protein